MSSWEKWYGGLDVIVARRAKEGLHRCLTFEVLRLIMLTGTVEFTPLECRKQEARVMFTTYVPVSDLLLDPKTQQKNRTCITSTAMKHLGSLSRSGISF